MKYHRSIKDWPEDERPRERLLKYGPDILSNAQVLAILLRTGSGDGSALDLARALIKKFGSLRALESAGLSELCGMKGMGPAKAAQLKAALALGKRMQAEPSDPKDPFRTSEDVYKYYSPRLDSLKKEIFLCTLLDSKNRPFRDITVSEGTITTSLVHPREVFGPAIKESAVSVLFIHNHPSGDPAPSREDLEITKRLVETGKVVGIGVLDHIIIGNNGKYVSFLDKGLL